MKRTDWREAARGLGARLGKLKYPILVLLLGLVLLALPPRGEKTAEPEEPDSADSADSADSGDGGVAAVEARMERILGEIEGAGRVRVMLQYAAGEKSIYQTDSEQEVRTGEEEKETRTSVQTVLASKESSRDSPVVVQTIYPTFRGALVVSEGAGDSAVKLNLVNAVSSLTGLGADKITVIKMKSE